MLTDAQVYCMTSMIYFDHHLPLKPSIGKRRKQNCTPNIKFNIHYVPNDTESNKKIRKSQRHFHQYLPHRGIKRNSFGYRPKEGQTHQSLVRTGSMQ